MIKRYADAPEWFVNKDYGYLHALDAADWLIHLQKCKHLDDETKIRMHNKLHPDDKKPTHEETWKDTPAAGFIPAYLGPPTVSVVNKANPEGLDVLQRHILTLEICLASSNADIMARVEEELLHARKTYENPVARPGKEAPIGSEMFARWSKCKIVQISELYDWASKESRKLPNADLGRWLFGGYADPDKEVCTALKERQHAFALVPALWAQLNVTNTPPN